MLINQCIVIIIIIIVIIIINLTGCDHRNHHDWCSSCISGIMMGEFANESENWDDNRQNGSLQRHHHHHQYIGHIMGGLVTRYQTKKIKFLDFLCSSNFSSIFFRIFSLIPNNASIQEVV